MSEQRWSLRLRAVAEPAPGPRWAGLFRESWPAFRRLYLEDRTHRHPQLDECEDALERWMPEWLPTWKRLCAIGGADDLAACFLSQWGLPSHLRGCSQAAWPRDEPLLVRNHDDHPDRLDGLVLRTEWDARAVLGTSDGLVGLLDGVNEVGLCVSLSFGGPSDWSVGFGAPLVLRYLLQTCATLAEAREVLRRTPFHAAYNVTVLDAVGGHVTGFVGPNRAPLFREQAAVTNHQPEVSWPNEAEAASSLKREGLLRQRLGDPEMDRERFVRGFLEPPLRRCGFGTGSGTLYTLACDPVRRSVRYLWPGVEWEQSLDEFREEERVVELVGE